MMHFMPDINRSSLPKCVHHFLLVMLGTGLLVIFFAACLVSLKYQIALIAFE